MRLPGELDWANQGSEVRRLKRIADGGVVRWILGALERVDCDLPECVGISERLGPLLFLRALPGVDDVAARLASKRRFEWEGRRPPHFRTHALSELAHRLDSGREKQRGRDGHDLRVETLLARLGNEGLEVRDICNPANDVAILSLVFLDLR